LEGLAVDQEGIRDPGQEVVSTPEARRRVEE
jgi:hypothetical protein